MKDRQGITGGITFGDWRLVPLDSRNWELCHRREVDGEERWSRRGRYYQAGTIPEALFYAADQEMRAKCADEAHDILDALREYRELTDALKAELLDGISRLEVGDGR